MRATLSKYRFAALAILGAFAVAVGFTAFDIVPAASQDSAVRAWSVPTSDALMNPWSSFWGEVQPVTVALSMQNVTKPFGGGEVATMRVRAAHDDQRLYVTVEWNDKTLDDTVNSQTAFSDATAVEFPATPGVNVPSFCMGDATGSVNIWQWKASWQRDIDQGFASVTDRYPNTDVDLYPSTLYSQADRGAFLPAQDVGNPVAQRSHATPVENLVAGGLPGQAAGGFGSLTTADVQDIQGVGKWQDDRWRVTYSRALTTSPGYPSLAIGDTTNVAFAVWDGSKGNRDGLKSVSQFLNLQLSGTPFEPGAGGFPWWGWVIVGGVIAVGLAGAGWGYLVYARKTA